MGLCLLFCSYLFTKKAVYNSRFCNQKPIIPKQLFSFISLTWQRSKTKFLFSVFFDLYHENKAFRSLFFSFSNFFHYSILRRKYIRLLILLSFLPLITIITTTSFWIWKIYGLQKYETNNSFKCAIFHWYPIKIRPLKTFSYLNCYFIHFVDEGRK